MLNEQDQPSTGGRRRGQGFHPDSEVEGGDGVRTLWGGSSGCTEGVPEGVQARRIPQTGWDRPLRAALQCHPRPRPRARDLAGATLTLVLCRC